MEAPEALATSGANLREQQVARVYALYRSALTEANALDFDDLLL